MENKLQQIRNQKGLSQEELADKAGVSRLVVTRIESQTHEPSIRITRKLAKALGVKIGDIFFE